MKRLHNALQLKQLYQLKELGYRYTDAKPFSYESSPLELPNSLPKLQKQAKECHLCSLSKGRTKTVFGEGNPQANIMFVGDHPMEVEDSKGSPFLGRSGEMLTLMIEKVLKLPRAEVYITNLLKCHPSAKIELHESYMHSCKAYLFKEIELIKPKVIITLGEMPYHYLTNDTTPLKEIRGVVKTTQHYTLIPTYHPNFLLKNPSFKRDVLGDLKRVLGVI